MKRTVLAFLIVFFFATAVLAADGDPKRAVVGVWTMGFCQAQAPRPYPLPFGCTTQIVNFHEDGTVWSSYMFDQFPASSFGGLSVGATGNWYYLGDNQFFVTMLRFVNNTPPGTVQYLLRTDFTVRAYHQSDEAVTGKMVFMFYSAESASPLSFPVVKLDPYLDTPNEIRAGPYMIPMKRVPSYVPDSPVLQ